MAISPERKRIVLRYSIAMLLFLVSCLCGYLGGFRYGYKIANEKWRYEKNYAKVYNVADLVGPQSNGGPVHAQKADFENLLTIVKHEGNDQPENSFEISPDKVNLSLIVNANGVVHRRVYTLLSDLRKALPLANREEVESNPKL